MRSSISILGGINNRRELVDVDGLGGEGRGGT